MPDPFEFLGASALKVVADGWTLAMLTVWSAGLWLLRFVLGIIDAFTVPDLRAGGPGAQVYRFTFWMASVLVLILALAQVGIAAFRRDGASLARVAIGAAQFVVVWAAWLVYGAAVLIAVGGLTDALLAALLGVDTWAAWEPWGEFSTEDVTDGAVATVLGVMGFFLIFAAVGHLVVMLTRAGALLVLAAVTPIAAAGAVSELGKSWLWKSLRWFHAAALAPVLMVLVLGIGVQFTSGVATGGTSGIEGAIGTAVPGIALICIGCFSPLALFKLLAFVDPGTSSGTAMRAGLAGVGGLQGVLSGGSSSTSSAASTTDSQGRSQGELSGASDTSARAAQASGSMLGTVGAMLGPAGAALGTGASMVLGAMATVGTKGAVVAADVDNQMGTGQNTYIPDINRGSSRGGGRGSNPEGRGRDDTGGPDSDGDTGGGEDDGGPATDTPPAALSPDSTPGHQGDTPTPTPTPPRPAGPPSSPAGAPAAGGPGGQGPAGPGGAGGGGAGGAAAGAKAVPVVPA